MPLRRVMTVLLLSLAALLVVVVLRTETARMHYEISKQDRQADLLRQMLQEKELELARMSRPAEIKAKVEELRGEPRP